MGKHKFSPKRCLLLVPLAVWMMISMLLVPPAATMPARAQDPTLLYLEGEKLKRQAELEVQRQAAVHAQQTTQAQVRATNAAIAATGTRTILDITVAAATALYWSGQTQTPMAQTRVADQATATAQTVATATGFANATGTAQATQTQIAATRTATAEMAQARQTATMAAILQKGEQDRLAAENRQRLMSQVRQAIYLLGAFILLAMGAAVVVLVWRMVFRPKPVQVVEVVKEPEERPLTPEEIAEIQVPSPIVVNDENLARQIWQNLRASGAL